MGGIKQNKYHERLPIYVARSWLCNWKSVCVHAGAVQQLSANSIYLC